MVTGPVGERLQAGTEDAPVLDRPAPLRRLRESGAAYKYPDLLTYLLTELVLLIRSQSTFTCLATGVCLVQCCATVFAPTLGNKLL